MSEVKFCKFAQHYHTDLKYICYKYEKCCPEGCCSTYSYRYLQSWYFWGLIFFIFGIFYLLSWYCKKVQKRMRTQTLQNNSERSHSSSTTNSPRGQHNIDLLLDNLIQNYRTRLTMADNLFPNKNCDIPPGYEQALNMPKPNEENVPSYEDATKDNNTNNIV